MPRQEARPGTARPPASATPGRSARRTKGRASTEGHAPLALTPLGERLEELRRERTLSKSHFAERADMSRVHYWRAITGRAVFSMPEVERLAAVLHVSMRALLPEEPDADGFERAAPESGTTAEAPGELADYMSHFDRIVRTLRTMPSGVLGRTVKVAFLNHVEEVAHDLGERLPPEFWRIRQAVHEGTL